MYMYTVRLALSVYSGVLWPCICTLALWPCLPVAMYMYSGSFGPVSVCTVLPVAMYIHTGCLVLSMYVLYSQPVAMYIHTGCLVLSMYVLYSQPVAVCMCALSVWISVHSLAVCTLFDHLCVYNVPVLTLCILFRSRCIVWLCVYCGPALSVMFGPVIWPCLYCLAL